MKMDSGELIRALKAAGEPSRLRMLRLCRSGELTVGEITRILGQSQPRVSRHLKVLCEANLLERFRERHSVYYRVAARGPFADLVADLLSAVEPNDDGIARDIAIHRRVLEERMSQAGAGVERNRNWAGASGSVADEGRIRWTVLNLMADTPVGKLLDIGTGSGRMLRLLGRRAEEAVGLDISARVLAGTRGSVHGAGLSHCTLRHGDMYALPFDAGSFDTVAFDEVLSEAEDTAEALAEAARVAKPGARMLIIDSVDGTGPILDTERLSRHLAGLGIEPLRSVPVRLSASTLVAMLFRTGVARRPAA